jgi:amidase
MKYYNEKTSHLKKYAILLLIFLLPAFKQERVTVISPWIPYDESKELAENAKNPSVRMRYKLIQSKVLDKNDIWKNISGQISNFSEEEYQRLKPLILEQDIPAIQASIISGKLTYEKLTQWYLFRIVKYENDRNRTLNNIIAINPDAVREARKRDRKRSANYHPIYGMPILLKDNIGMAGLPTTAGAVAFRDNNAPDAFIVARIKEKGGIILGKVNLSEWANYLCQSCPNGYSAVGGQTLNPYGRRVFDTGGSSSGSGTSMAANYASAAVGTETSGSILSPSNSNSVVGLKPTIGLLSRGGIVPISGTLDTPGPITRNVTDNAILLSAMSGEDKSDIATKNNPKNKKYWEDLKTSAINGLRFGVYRNFLTDSVLKLSVEKIRTLGGIIIEIEPGQTTMRGFGTLLSADMKADLPEYIKKYGSANITFRSIADIADFNRKDSLVRIPYGQARFEEMAVLDVNQDTLNMIKSGLRKEGVNYFEKPMVQYQLDAIISVGNRSAGNAAAAMYPCLIVPMGYRKTGEPTGITFIARPFQEDKLLRIGYAFEQAGKARKIPEEYN